MKSAPTALSSEEAHIDSLRRRCHENSVESYRVFARTTPGGVISERSGLVLVDCLATDSMGNVAIATAPADDPERMISEAETFFGPNRRPWMLFALPEAAPGLERAARDHGLREEGWFPGLLLDPIPMKAPAPPEGVEAHTVDTVEELQRFERAASRAYEVESGPVYAGWLNYPGFSFHLAYHRGEPVATATLVASHGIAGIVYVGTVPEAGVGGSAARPYGRRSRRVGSKDCERAPSGRPRWDGRCTNGWVSGHSPSTGFGPRPTFPSLAPSGPVDRAQRRCYAAESASALTILGYRAAKRGFRAEWVPGNSSWCTGTSTR